MNALLWMQPRDPRSAGRVISVLSAVAVGVTAVSAPLQPAEHHMGRSSVIVTAAIVALGVVLSALVTRFHEAHRWAWALCPLLAVAAITAVDLLTSDASMSAQIFFLFPALYGASQLRPPGAVVMTAASVIGEVIVVGAQLPLRQAVVDAGYVTAALVTTTVLLAAASERQARLVARLEAMAAIDSLTGLVTRRVFDEAASSALSSAGNDAGTALILIDVDHFKTINDRFGHPAGDEVLVQLAELLVEHTRDGDVVCRMGGDEIAVLLPGCTHEASVHRAREILDAVQTHTFLLLDGAGVEVSISMGLAHAPSHAIDLRRLYQAADAALYRAKQGGRNQLAAADAPVRT
ncbi:GGDEF domain-containing protein [Nocardioides bizhenqiangii]|uniref:GGDEF domain-containing protein n=1 Tax=Nocardioides bizhenqiangii TaxID=3095076 RepID=A0ABZ0ZS44_9ACTN|nr:MULTISPECIES: GGDEF domain-containing protein [unclassified Nocardioides]MDZ5623553.1 GGDEF domain-containing protein [Nocardioides sp. HM23]WQQ27163.1 GGDEF domain-containing protein [Nocardioides sp. HM61]